jgi:hypothetical protein
MTDLLEQRLLLHANSLDDSDWLAVRRRARRPRRRAAIAAVAAAIATLLVVPALGVSGRLLDLIEGTPAPPQVQTSFAANDAMRQKLFANAAAAGHQLQGRYSSVDAAQARGVAAIESPDGPIYLWAAPTADGGQCWLIQAGADPETGRPYGFGSCDETSKHRTIVPDLFWTAERPNIKIVHARVYESAITRIDVEAEGAETLTLPVVSGHALGTVPKDAQVQAYVGRNATGDVVSRWTPPS